MNKTIRVLQIIDSLDVGGAEMMAINIANLLVNKNIASFLCVTRNTGLLEEKIDKRVGKIILNKKKVIDVIAIKKLIAFIKHQKINILHAHSSSFFTAILVKIVRPKIKIVWHDHYGNSELLTQRSKFPLNISSLFFSQIVVVNQELKKWSQNFKTANKIHFLKNFAVLRNENRLTELNGENTVKIICLAAFRPQKDHLNLLNAFKSVTEETAVPISLHLVGGNKNDDYYRLILSFIQKNKLNNKIFIYPKSTDITPILNQVDVGVLSSYSEGLPVALLEYGLAGLPVVVTNVGQCKDVVGDYGKVVDKQNTKELSDAIKSYVMDLEKRQSCGSLFKRHIQKKYSGDSFFKQLITIYNLC